MGPSENASDFVRSLLQRDAKLRCNATTALRLPFVCQANLLSSELSLTPTLREARRHTRKFQSSPLLGAWRTQRLRTLRPRRPTGRLQVSRIAIVLQTIQMIQPVLAAPPTLLPSA